MAHERTRQEMRQILEEDTELGFLDAGAEELLSEARKFYRDARLGDRMVLKDGEALLILPWSGDLAQNALLLLLRSLGLETGSNDGLVVRCEGWDLDRLSDACSDIVNLNVVDLIAMLENVENLGAEQVGLGASTGFVGAIVRVHASGYCGGKEARGSGGGSL